MRTLHKSYVIATGLTCVLLIGAVAAFMLGGSSDCTSIETYDATSDTCYYDCTSDEDCAAKAQAVDNELNGFFADSKTKSATRSETDRSLQALTRSDATKLPDKGFTGSDTDGTIYTVMKDVSLRPTPTKSDQQLWNLFSRVAGKADVARYIQSFEVFDDSSNDSAASVWQSQTAGKWHVNVNAAYRKDTKDVVHTMVHEYGHIVSLNSAQVTAAVDGSCPNLMLDEGCAKSDVYIATFYNQFWKKYGSEAPANQGQNTDEVDEFYEQHKSAFVSTYAATNYGEDWAESWAAFVTQSKPAGSREKDQKVRFFYQYPELVAARNRIRVEIAQSL